MSNRTLTLAAAALCAAAFLDPAPGQAQSLSDQRAEAGAAFEDGRYDDAAAIWERMVQDGDPDAAGKLAQLYRLGLGVPKDDARAFELYTTAAERGVAPAQVNLAFLLLTGEGVAKDEREAARWFAKAADQGDALAQFNLGLMYEKGVGVSADPALAKELYQLAAAQGQKRALARLDAMEASLPPNGGADAGGEAETAGKDAPTEEGAAENDTAATDPDSGEEARPRRPRPAGIRPRENGVTDAPEPDPAGPVLSIRRSDADDAPAMDKSDAGSMAESETEADQGASKDAMSWNGALAARDDEAAARRPSGAASGANSGAKSDDRVAAAGARWPVPRVKPPQYRPRAGRETALSQPEAIAAQPAPAARPAARGPAARMAEGRRAYEAGRYREAAAIFEMLAARGSPAAEFWLGRLYNRGEGVPLDRFEAYSLWRSAAQRGNGPAATALANLAARLSAEEIAAAEDWHRQSGRAR